MKDSGIEWLGDIPSDWPIFRIANLYEERSEAGLEELPILTVSINSGVSDHEIADEDKDRVFVRSEDRTKYKRVYPGDLTYNMMRAWQGAFGAVRVEGMVSPAYVVAKPKKNMDIDSRYMEALLRTSEATEEMHRYSRGIVDFRLRLYWPEFKNIRICLPPIEEQKEIADYIDVKANDIDTLIIKKEQFLTELENYKKSLIYEYVTGKKEVSQS
jgi:type I restriction enzyme S subunit